MSGRYLSGASDEPAAIMTCIGFVTAQNARDTGYPARVPRERERERERERLARVDATRERIKENSDESGIRDR